MQRTILTLLFLLCFLGPWGKTCLAQKESVLVDLGNAKGGWPISTLIYDPASAAFYGTAEIGGATNNGTVFQLKQDLQGDWKVKVLYNFLGVSSLDCSEPDFGLTPVRQNGVITALYGTCDFGGQNDQGAVFQLTRQPEGSWKEAIIYSFQSIADGGTPLGGVTLDPQGNLYGTTQVGGSAGLGGTVYKLTHAKSGWSKSVLHSFNSPANPECHLILDRRGVVYGTTPSDGPSFSGTVFTLTPPSAGQNDWTYTVLHTFTGATGTGDGASPRAGLIIDGSGSVYGTTEGGGNSGLGTVFKLIPPAAGQPDWTEEQVYKFTSVGDGAGPVGGLTFGAGGTLYGTTSEGGAFFGGTAFQLNPKSGKWIKTMLWNFGGGVDGSSPWASMLLEGGSLYGTTSKGGLYTYGALYRVILPVPTTTALVSLNNPSVYGQMVKFTADVSSAVGTPPDGETVTFRQGSTVLGTASIIGGVANFSSSTLGVGTKLVTAIYAGDENFAASTSKSLSQLITEAVSTTTLISSENPSNSGQSVTLTAGVSPQFSGSLNGTVTFYDGMTILKTVSLSGDTAKFATSTLTSGIHYIKATYSGSTDFLGSSDSLTQTVK